MPFKSSFPDLDIPQTDLLSYLFGKRNLSDEPLWFNSRQPEMNLSPKGALQWVKRLGVGLSQLGINKGDVILIFTPNHIFVPVAYLGIVGSGYVFSGANPSYTGQELAHQLSNSTAKVVLAHPAVLDRAIAACDMVGIQKDRIFQFSDEVEPTRNGIEDWTCMLGTPQQAENWSWPLLTSKESTQTIATINYSSGTTGLPKGVCVSHSNLIANLEQSYFMRYVDTPYLKSGTPPQERWIGFLPLYHAYGQLYTILMALKLENPVYVMTEFNFERFLDAISRHKITTLQVAPPVLVMLSKRPETSKYDLSSVEEIRCGAAPLSRELQNDCRKKLGIPIRQGWGMTELTCASITQPSSSDDVMGTVGNLMPNSHCKLLDDEGQEVGIDTPGELCIKGPNVCLGYWRNEKATRETIQNGWLRTGDVAIRNKDGLFWIVDRKKELIKVNGLQVAPAELEAVLLENEHVADAAVVGITIHGNELPRAYVVLQLQSREKLQPVDIEKWITSRVAKHKRLGGGVVFIEEVPKLASGKIQRKVMREWAKRDAADIEKRGEGKLAAKL
ncbi:hypothetical protein MAA_11276 [Metarhizium robertsii ARSEF 23]|uniref:4-coumarate-CoA ligase n=1 Tax=Metarhizium robertsii (strain ARSEF 23 / ATCC MYA-3075) TaxID=655844 RepID=A0A0B2X8K4_METRA|nr:uncharacterized protein MAA_11276 [Metarhizium robertsii ARSEF 23]KHO11198.1 hypothetical protein MAA_11276 [Metarhizium robertsii ARSEF 23]